MKKTTTPKILIFIGARAGSKGVKGKNFRKLLGKPLVLYTIEQAIRWGKADRIIVSTDSEKIVRIAKHAGLDVPFLRPKVLATDKAKKGLAIRHALLMCEKIYQERYDIIIDLDVTAPVRTKEDLDRCLDLYLKYKPATILSVVPAHKNPYFNMVEETKEGRVTLSKKLKGRILRRQDAPKVYSANAAIYFYGREYLLHSPYPYPLTKSTKIYVMDELAGIDIDREIDFKFVEFLLKEKIVKF